MLSISQAFNNWPEERSLSTANQEYSMDLKRRGLEEVSTIADEMLPPVFTISLGGPGPRWCSWCPPCRQCCSTVSEQLHRGQRCGVSKRAFCGDERFVLFAVMLRSCWDTRAGREADFQAEVDRVDVCGMGNGRLAEEVVCGLRQLLREASSGFQGRVRISAWVCRGGVGLHARHRLLAEIVPGSSCSHEDVHVPRILRLATGSRLGSACPRQDLHGLHVLKQHRLFFSLSGWHHDTVGNQLSFSRSSICNFSSFFFECVSSCSQLSFLGFSIEIFEFCF